MEQVRRQQAVAELRKMAALTPGAVFGAAKGVGSSALKAVPVLGNVISGASGVYNLATGNPGTAALDFAGMLPGIGNTIQLGRAGYELGKTVQQPQQPPQPKMASAPLVGWDKASRHERGLAFEAGVEGFCKEAGFDTDDLNAMYRLIIKSSEFGNIIDDVASNVMPGVGAANKALTTQPGSQIHPSFSQQSWWSRAKDWLNNTNTPQQQQNDAAELAMRTNNPNAYTDMMANKQLAELDKNKADWSADAKHRADVRFARRQARMDGRERYRADLKTDPRFSRPAFGTGANGPVQAQYHPHVGRQMPTPEAQHVMTAPPHNGGYFSGSPPAAPSAPDADGMVTQVQTPPPSQTLTPPSSAPGGAIPEHPAAAAMPPGGTAPKASPVGKGT